MTTTTVTLRVKMGAALSPTTVAAMLAMVMHELLKIGPCMPSTGEPPVLRLCQQLLHFHSNAGCCGALRLVTRSQK
eukprot:CAMPEP_0179318494 /NCGR_PEP_ID=MMETSP0797-20121207/56915_1 /TAXON_ID=47934 /ORGANISM="Dinophysis acuminata, Strain DAEP01" /LENGTH=75 /DNA_ID=CAMNT_0021029669 /DNA_START=19 /DNA_END=246 /DNA_ORIENTATION=+